MAVMLVTGRWFVLTWKGWGWRDCGSEGVFANTPVPSKCFSNAPSAPVISFTLKGIILHLIKP